VSADEQTDHQWNENKREQALDDVPGADRRVGDNLSGPQGNSDDLHQLKNHGPTEITMPALNKAFSSWLAVIHAPLMVNQQSREAGRECLTRVG